MKKSVLLTVALLAVSISKAQTVDELKAAQALKKDSVAAIQGRVDAIQGQIDALPGWKKGLFGTIGANLSGSKNWYSQGIPNNSSGNIGIGVNGFANLNQDKYFWRNALNVNLQWVKIDNKDIPTDNDSFNGTTDVLNITSLYGYKLSSKFEISDLGE